MTQRQVPSVGRIVHVRSHGSPDGKYPGGICRAAIVTEVFTPGHPESPINAAVLNPTGLFFNQGVPFGDGPGEWHWPEYVPPVTVGELPDLAG